MREVIQKLWFVLPLLMFLGCSSSSSSSDNEYSLDGTTWEYTYEEGDTKRIEQIEFDKETVKYAIGYFQNNNGFILNENIEHSSLFEGTYTYNHPNVTMYVTINPFKGTISDDKLTIKVTSGEVQVFTKR